MEDVEIDETEVVMEDSGETPMAEEGTPESTGAIHIPMAALGRDVEAGQTITLRVVSSDENGVQAEVVSDVSSDGPEYEEAGSAFDRMSAEPQGY